MTRATGPDVHAAAQGGFSKEAGSYSRGRPDYPPQLQGWLAGTLGLVAGRGDFHALRNRHQ